MLTCILLLIDATDVICARGKEVYNHEGNKRFRALVKSYLPTYSQCVTKMQKTRLVSTIIDTVRARSNQGGFVKNVGDQWYEVGDRRAKEKTGQTMRDLLHTRYSSSTKAKARARRQLREDHSGGLRPHLDSSTFQRVDAPPSMSFMPRLQPEQAAHDDQFISDKRVGGLDDSFGNMGAPMASAVAPGFKFSLADEVFSFPDKPSPTLDPLPLNEAVVDVDFAKLPDDVVSDDAFQAAMDSLFTTYEV